MNPLQYIFEALGGVVHEAQLEPLLVPEALGQGVPDVIRGKGFLPAVLELRKYCLQCTKYAGISLTDMSSQNP